MEIVADRSSNHYGMFQGAPGKDADPRCSPVGFWQNVGRNIVISMFAVLPLAVTQPAKLEQRLQRLPVSGRTTHG
eukprot:2712313-Amphidinium_carterae.1